ncbi:bifunctional 3-(3-hydroxy-phenyl)propionate/3-hydroxycinnamic acid hydroxylase [Pseudonocardia sp. ICBG601]|uniref:bifunctional 3-(3-hydroxy-phenyl)propionate/3-hydroxycinnamic acid hydroxylase MhpA n=1 Tax=Pseudonocardia sp. ICBG601 TaxID=2846759 RepID=UPI001CF699D5|nr:bifunctional 3-(3-hydroxy-phenyl)propionate/3-hydroxycinnamic acid hydroxylase [Pseudonocardia sp. ICBG601]
MSGPLQADVVVVGFGPVGQVATLLLARPGRRIVVLERWPRPYPMPRAVSFDGESGRILAATGIGDRLAEVTEPSRDYVWQNGAGTVLFEVDVSDRGRSGHPDSSAVYQPGLESALAERAESSPGVTVLRGHEVIALDQDADRVRVVTAGPDPLEVEASWLVGCDGANSTVRAALDLPVTDFGYFDDWLTCDVTVHDGRVLEPNNLQVCDPARPRTAVSAGPGHRRWEFMRLPDEDPADFGTADSAWRLLGLFGLDPGNATLDRHAVYTFQARFANDWRSGRVLLAGDAAHLMPPFAGQGMCSGLRDAANLAWKLDLVLRGAAADSLLDSYTVERRAHVQHAIGMSMNLGRVICQTDPKAAADRDTAMAAAAARRRGTPAEPAVTALTRGVLRRDPTGLGGVLGPQGTVTRDGVTGLFDDIVGTGFVLLSTLPVEELLDPARRTRLAGLGAHLVQVAPAGSDAAGVLQDHDDVYLPLLADAGAVAALVRPDFYLFGGASDTTGARALVDDLLIHLGSERLSPV